MEKNEKGVELPIIDLSSPDRIATAQAIHQACLDSGFFYLINHGIDNALFDRVFEEIKKFFSLPLEEKAKLPWSDYRGYVPRYGEKIDPDSKGDPNETFHLGPTDKDRGHLNLWPSPQLLPSWRSIMELYYEKVRVVETKLISLICLALNLEEGFFEKEGPFNPIFPLVYSPGKVGLVDEQECRVSAHSDYGMMTLLANDGNAGLQVCREKFKQPQIWEDVRPIRGAFIVNVGDMMERWTNGQYQSILHRVIPTGQDRYSLPYFIYPDNNTLIECLKSCCSEASPPRFLPIRSLDYLDEKMKATEVAK